MAAKRKGTAAATADSPENWQLENDVRSLARAEAIKKDPDHHKKVKEHAKKMLHEHKRLRDEHQAVVDMADED